MTLPMCLISGRQRKNFVVEKIIDSKVEDGERMYLVKWENFPEVKINHLCHCSTYSHLNFKL